MKEGVLITLPASDDVTEYLSAFSRSIFEACEKSSTKITSLEKEKVTKKNFFDKVKSYDYNFIVFNGHGGKDYIKGHKDEVLVKVGESENLLNGRITYARSCWAAKEIGTACIKNNPHGCVIGYEIPFMFLMDITWSTSPLKDKIAKIFFTTSNLVPLGIIKGHTTKKSHENAKASMLKEIKKSLMRKDKDSQIRAQTLWNNYIGQCLIGNSEMRM